MSSLVTVFSATSSAREIERSEQPSHSNRRILARRVIESLFMAHLEWRIMPKRSSIISHFEHRDSQFVGAVLPLRRARKRVAPATGFGPATSRLTIGCSCPLELRRDGRYRRITALALGKVVGHQAERPRPL